LRSTRALSRAARIKAGRIDLQEAEEDVEALVREACADAMPTAEQRSVKLLAVVPRNFTVVCDRARIQQVFANLIENAIKFSPEGGTVTVRASASEARFEVQDAAGGIPAEQIPRLFDRFWQAPDRARGGTGLGLAIAKGIIDSHGGRIGVESAVGVGSTFFFTLPLRGR